MTSRPSLRTRTLLSVARRDLLLLLLISVASLATALYLDPLAPLVARDRRWQTAQDDEITVALVFSLCGFVVFVWRRWRDLRSTIAAYRQALAELRDSEARFRAIFQNA